MSLLGEVQTARKKVVTDGYEMSLGELINLYKAVFGLKSSLAQLVVSRKAKTNIAALDFVISEMDKIASMNMASAIDTESNLTSKVFTNIALSLNISILPYETKFNLIDESLVRRRNKIAHGEFIDLSRDSFILLADEILQLMRNYKTDIENAATLGGYQRLTSRVPPTPT
jgi:hypothetical protein